MEQIEAPLRFGVIGLGKIARTRFIPAAERVPAIQLSAVGTSHGVRATDVTAPVMTYDELIGAGRSLVDAVYIALPNDMHEPWILRAAESGLHVLCEKPMSASEAAALRCLRATQDHGVLLAEAFMYRHAPRHHRVRELIRSERIGRVHLIEATFSYVLEDVANIRLQPQRWGGALMDVGCYGIDLARFVFDEEPAEVSARCIRGTRSSVDQLVAVTLVFASGRMALISASTHLAREHRYLVRGTQGTMTVAHAFNPTDEEITQILIETQSGIEQECFGPHRAFDAQIEHFARAALANDASLLRPTENGVGNAKVIEAALASMSQGIESDAYV